jgi:hypothetical protein
MRTGPRRTAHHGGLSIPRLTFETKIGLGRKSPPWSAVRRGDPGRSRPVKPNQPSRKALNGRWRRQRAKFGQRVHISRPTPFEMQILQALKYTNTMSLKRAGNLLALSAALVAHVERHRVIQTNQFRSPRYHGWFGSRGYPKTSQPFRK